MALAAYATEYSTPQLTANQLDIVGKIIAALSPIEEITKAISANASSMSLIIPFVQCYPKTMEKHHNDKGVRTKKSEMLTSLKTRFSDMENDECLVIDTLLNPRKFFSGPGERAAARQLLENKKEEEVWLLKKLPQRNPGRDRYKSYKFHLRS